MDGFRKVPDNVPNQDMLKKYLELPLTKVPDPFEKYESFGAHNNQKLIEFLKKFDFKFEFISSTECYKSGKFDNALKKILQHYQTIKNIILSLLNDGTLTFPQIRKKVKKSPATVSVCLSRLFKSGIVEKTYDIPSNKYTLKNPELVKGVLKVYFPDKYSRLVNNTIELLDF